MNYLHRLVFLLLLLSTSNISLAQLEIDHDLHALELSFGESPTDGAYAFSAFAKQLLDKGDSSRAVSAYALLASCYIEAYVSNKAKQTLELASDVMPMHPTTAAQLRYISSEIRLLGHLRLRDDVPRLLQVQDSLTALMSDIDLYWQAQLKYNHSDAAYHQTDVSTSLHYANEMDSLANLALNPKLHSQTYQHLVWLCFARQEYKEVEQNIKKARGWSKKINDQVALRNLLLQAAVLDETWSHTEEGLERLDSARLVFESLKLDTIDSRDNRIRGGLLVRQGRWDEAIELYEQQIAYEMRTKADPSHSYFWLGFTKRKAGRLNQAAKDFQTAHEIAVERQIYARAQFYAKELSKTLETSKDFEGALRWHLISEQSADSVSNDKLKKQEAVAELRFETRAQQQQLQLLESQRAQAQTRFLLILVASVLGLLLAGMTYYAFRQRQKVQAERLLSAEVKNQSLTEALLSQNQKLSIQALTLVQKNDLLKRLEGHMLELRRTSEGSLNPAANQISRAIKHDVTKAEDWSTFLTSYEESNAPFISQLRESHPKLTPHDYRLIALVRTNVTNKEIAQALTISEAGVKKAKYRLRIKLGLDAGEKVATYLNNFSSKKTILDA
ncbi:MAG: hypothetical protein AB8F78_20125 [Saprospiraceae bacterium]